jgi:hypothetical protein
LPSRPSHERYTDALDALGLLLLAAAPTGGLWPWIGAWALGSGGVVVLAGSWLIARPPKPPRPPGAKT